MQKDHNKSNKVSTDPSVVTRGEREREKYDTAIIDKAKVSKRFQCPIKYGEITIILDQSFFLFLSPGSMHIVAQRNIQRDYHSRRNWRRIETNEFFLEQCIEY